MVKKIIVLSLPLMFATSALACEQSKPATIKLVCKCRDLAKAPGGYPPPPMMDHYRGQPHGPMMAPGGYPPPPMMDYYRGQPHGPMMAPGGYPPPPINQVGEAGSVQKSKQQNDNGIAPVQKDQSWW